MGTIKTYVIRMLAIMVVLIPSSEILAQKEIKQTRKGNRLYGDGGFSEAEILYRKAADINPAYANSTFNLGDALYKQEKFSDASKSFAELAEREIKTADKAETLYNLGNALLNDNRLEESIEAYKSSLRLVPGNRQAKYNLAYAQDMLQKQQQQEQENQDKDQKQDDQNKDQQQDDQNKDQPQNDQNKDQQQDDQNKDQQQNQDKEDKQQDDQNTDQQQPQPQQISKEDAERLLKALAEDEQSVQDKVKKARAERRRVRTLKNW